MPRAGRARWPVIVVSAVCLCVVLYLCTGVFGYLAFGSGVHGDILLNFAASDRAASVGKALMVIHIALALPIIVVPCRRAVVLLWFYMSALRRDLAGQRTVTAWLVCAACSSRASRRAAADRAGQSAVLLLRSSDRGGVGGGAGGVGSGAAATSASSEAEDESMGSDGQEGGTRRLRAVVAAASADELGRVSSDSEGASSARRGGLAAWLGMDCALRTVAINGALVFGGAGLAILFPQVRMMGG